MKIEALARLEIDRWREERAKEDAELQALRRAARNAETAFEQGAAEGLRLAHGEAFKHHFNRAVRDIALLWAPTLQEALPRVLSELRQDHHNGPRLTPDFNVSIDDRNHTVMLVRFEVPAAYFVAQVARSR